MRAVLYRQAGDPDWRDGQTVNVSRTGVLFQAAPPALAPSARVEMVVAMPGIGTTSASRLHFAGRIVRTCGLPPDEQVSIAATIEDYQFLKPSA